MSDKPVTLGPDDVWVPGSYKKLTPRVGHDVMLFIDDRYFQGKITYICPSQTTIEMRTNKNELLHWPTQELQWNHKHNIWERLFIESNTPVEKEDKCYHDWVTQTMFQFDMTYCSKCGEEKNE